MNNPHHDLSLDACVTIRESCPVEYAVDGPLTEFSFGSHRDGLRVAFDAKALGTLVQLGSRAMAELETLATQETQARQNNNTDPATADTGELATAGERS